MTSSRRRTRRAARAADKRPARPPLPRAVAKELPAGALLVVPLAAALAFISSLRGGFVWDDTAFLPIAPSLKAVQNPLLLFQAGLWRFSLAESDVPIFRPVVALVLWALSPVLGDTPLPWHVLSVVMHVLASSLVAYLIFRLLPGRNVFAALVGGLLFAGHPIHTEAVAFVLAFNHPLATIFALGAAHAQLSHSRGGSVAWLLAAGTASALAMMTNEIGLTVPFLILLVEWSQRRRLRLPVVVAALTPLIVVMLLRSNALNGAVPVNLNAGSLAVAGSFGVAYLQNLLVPWPQHVWISVPRGGVAGPGAWFAASVLILGTAVVLLKTHRGERTLPTLAVGWMLLSLGPLILGALNPTPFFAPRGLYLPSVGLAMLVAWTCRHRESPRARFALAGATALALVACNLAGLGWRDERTVLNRMLAADPESAGAHLALARLASGEGSNAEANTHFQAAVTFSRGQTERLNALDAFAVHVSESGDLQYAEQLWREIVSQDPLRAVAWGNLGTALALQNRLEAARDAYLRATEIEPADRDAWWNLSLVLDALHDSTGAEEARRRFETP